MDCEVLYSAAHAEFPDTEPLGGGKTVADYLIREWSRAAGFRLTVLSPKSLGLLGDRDDVAALLRSAESEAGTPVTRRHGEAPLQSLVLNPLAAMSELEYARFCRAFEWAATAAILRHDPRSCVVLANDIVEGPDFAELDGRGYRVVSIWHVDVVEYFTKFYLRDWVKPETAARFRWFGLLPDVLRLVFEKQFECVRHSARIVVPSAPMREMIRRCYPWCPVEKITVLPWGDVAVRLAHSTSSGQAVAPCQLPDVADDEFVILTLSRLSPEKGIERLLEALGHLGTLNPPVRLVIAGAAAYMKGRAYERKLRRLASRLTGLRVDFPGHVTGAAKAALLGRADLFVSPSRHESYGLTIAEAAAAGCRVISHGHYGAQGQIVDCGDRRALAQALREQIALGRTVKSPAPPTPAASHAAQQLAQILLEESGKRMA